MAEEQPNNEAPATDAVAAEAAEAVPADEGAKSSLKTELEKFLVSDFCDVDHPRLDSEKTVGDAWDLMEEKQLDCLPIVDDDRVSRVVTRNNIETMKSVFFDAPGQQERQVRILCMPLNVVNQAQELKTIKESETLAKALELLVQNRIHSLPVVDDAGVFKGMLTTHAILSKLNR